MEHHDGRRLVFPYHDEVDGYTLRGALRDADGWLPVDPMPDLLIRSSCIITLQSPICYQLSALTHQLRRVTYTGGYVLPGTAPGPGQTPLPDDLEQAAVEQIAYWFQNRDELGLKTWWPSGGAYHQFATFDLLAPVLSVLRRYERLSISP